MRHKLETTTNYFIDDSELEQMVEEYVNGDDMDEIIDSYIYNNPDAEYFYDEIDVLLFNLLQERELLREDD